jgi:NADPH:quinone reductase-like Zn-dependent oxidoreductase
MRAIQYTEYGPPEVLNLKEIEKPKPCENELLIKIHATAVNSGDLKLRKAEPAAIRLFFGLFKPRRKILGAVFAGEVVSSGNKVSKFKNGDRVYGMTGMRMGGYAEYICIPENKCITLIPENLNYEEAASIPFGAVTAMHFLKKAKIQTGQKILINGASGAVGTAAIQIAKNFGAEVTAVCSSVNFDLVKSLGAEYVIDYKKQNFTLCDETYDVIYETVGKVPFSECIKVIKPKGTVLIGSGGISDMLNGVLKKVSRGINSVSGVSAEDPEDLKFVSKLIRSGIYRPVIDNVYQLEEIVTAHRYAELGHKRGNVVIKVSQG